MGARIERVAVEVTLPLRQEVLRPHQRMEDLALPGDDDPDTAHFAAFEDDDGEVVGTASVRRQPPPWKPDDATAWRLRGMATREGRRSRGIGSAVVAAVIDHVGREGGGLLWCHARVPAVAFYERAGFATRDAPWDEPAIGPHIAMDRQVSPSRGDQGQR